MSVTLNQIIGAALSTLGGVTVGLFLFWWRTRAEENEELRQWYAKTERLAERVTNSQQSQENALGELENPTYVRNTCAGVHTSLAHHLAEAPTGVNSDVVINSEELVEKCQSVKDFPEHWNTTTMTRTKWKSGIFDATKEAADQAEKVREIAESARMRV